MARPIVPLSNRDMGFLPGDISAKLDPYMQPLYDNLAVIQNQFSEKDTRHQQNAERRKTGYFSVIVYSGTEPGENIFYCG